MKKSLLFISLLLGIFTSQSQTSWELLNPKPTVDTGLDIHFVSESTGFIITDKELLETTNAGMTWQVKKSSIGAKEMDFHNATGFVVGSNGLVLKTTNSGNTWTQVTTGFNLAFNTVSVVDDNNIIIGAPYEIVKSTDGGNTWISLPISSYYTNQTFFVSPLVGHAATAQGRMFKTVNGGVSWYMTQGAIPSLYGYYDLYFVNENVGYSSRAETAVFKTIDGGETWAIVPLNGAAGYSPKFQFQFLSENIGYKVDGRVWKTNDGGVSWTQLSYGDSSSNQDVIIRSVYFHDENTGYASGNDGRIIKTTDGGVTWAKLSIYSFIYQLQFFDGNSGILHADDSFYKTTDGGNNWSLVGSIPAFLPSTSSSSQSESVFLNENVGYAKSGGYTYIPGNQAILLGGKLSKSVNGGATWTYLNNGEDIIDEGIFSVAFLDENIGFVSGGVNVKKVLKTTDGGMSWIQVAPFSFGEMQFIDNQVGYARNMESYETNMYDGELYKTTDGGNTWTVIYNADTLINSFHFADANTGYAVGQEGLIIKTVNAGTTWQPLEPFGANDYYYRVKFATANIGYITDDSSRTLKTVDGGLTWEVLRDDNWWTNVIELNGDKIFIAGEQGKLYRSNITFEPFSLKIAPAYNVNDFEAVLKANVASNAAGLSDLYFEYGINGTFTNTVVASPSTITAMSSSPVVASIQGLLPNTEYSYRLKGIYNLGMVFSNTSTFTTTNLGTTDVTLDKDVLVYPNPASQFVNIKLKDNSNAQAITIFDIIGKTILSRKLNDFETEININTSQLSKGIYIVKLDFADNISITKKLLIE